MERKGSIIHDHDHDLWVTTMGWVDVPDIVTREALVVGVLLTYLVSSIFSKIL